MRNIIFLMLDCLRADGVLGEDRGCQTPTLDRLVAEGSAFSQAISGCTTTSPAVSSMFTGYYPFVHGVRALRGYSLSPKVQTLAEILKEAGYQTYCSASGPLHPALGLDRGFDEYDYRKHERKYFRSEWGEGFKKRIREGGLEEPYFLWLHFWELHKPRQVPPGFAGPEFGRTPYEKALSALDRQLAEILEAAGGDPIVIAHGDHGEYFPPGGLQLLWYKLLAKLGRPVDFRLYWEGHGFHIYDSLVRVPLVFHGPGVFPGGKVVDRQVRQIDIFPTILEAAGLEVPKGIHGQSLLPDLHGAETPAPPAFLEACGIMIPTKEDWITGIRADGWKYTVALHNEKIPEQLFHVDEDPLELRNLAAERPDKVADLKERLMDIIRGKDFELTGEEMSQEDLDDVEERLKDLGYI